MGGWSAFVPYSSFSDRGSRPGGCDGRGVSGRTGRHLRATRLPGLQSDLLAAGGAAVRELQRVLAVERVLDPAGSYVDVQIASGAGRTGEAQSLPSRRQLRTEQQVLAVSRMPPKPATSASRPAGQRAMCEAVPGVVLDVVQIHQRRLGEVVGGEVEVTHLGGEHRLRARGSEESRTVSGS